MGAAKKWVQENDSSSIFSVVEGGNSESSVGPAKDFLVFQAFEDLKEFIIFLPFHMANWAQSSSHQIDELERMKSKNNDDFKYFNFF